MRADKLIFPDRCLFCGKVCVEGEIICRSCAKRLVTLPNPISGDKRTALRGVRWTVSPYRYYGGVRRGIQSFKFHGDRRAAEFFGAAIAREIERAALAEDFDCVAYVPMTEVKQNARGYNQAQLLAEVVAARLGKPVLAGVLGRGGLMVQHQLDARFRGRSAARSFSICEGAVIPALRVLLVDDIITTGQTVRCCANLLFSAGAAEVCLAAAAC